MRFALCDFRFLIRAAPPIRAAPVRKRLPAASPIRTPTASLGLALSKIRRGGARSGLSHTHRCGVSLDFLDKPVSRDTRLRDGSSALAPAGAQECSHGRRGAAASPWNAAPPIPLPRPRRGRGWRAPSEPRPQRSGHISEPRPQVLDTPCRDRGISTTFSRWSISPRPAAQLRTTPPFAPSGRRNVAGRRRLLGCSRWTTPAPSHSPPHRGGGKRSQGLASRIVMALGMDQVHRDFDARTRKPEGSSGLAARLPVPF